MNKRMVVVAFTSVVILLRLQSSKSDLVNRYGDWEEAYEGCKSQNDSLVSIQDIKNHNDSSVMEHYPIWSLVKGKFTPWIAYRGCYQGGPCSVNRCHFVVNNTVGNCYFECKTKPKHEGGCADTEHFYFGLQTSICLCLCDKAELSRILESTNCYLLCEHDINNGECGGDIHYSVFEVMTVTLSNTSFGGFCLTCRLKNGSIDLSSMECDENAIGYCGTFGNYVAPMDIMMSTFDAYWNRCKDSNLYIVGNTEQLCQKRSITIWTGLRKYKIERVKRDLMCFSIEKNDDIFSYRERNCTERLPFICKQHIEATNKTDMDYRTITTAVSPKSFSNPKTNDTLVIIISVCCAIIAVCVVFWLLHCKVLRKRYLPHATSHVHHDRIKQTNKYGESGSKTDFDLQNVYHTIVPDTGNDQFYDQIHK